MELSMSMFATQTDYWKELASLHEITLSEVANELGCNPDNEVLIAEIAALKKDAIRYRWLKERLIGADFDWNESGATILAFEFPRNVGIGGNCDQNIDAAIDENN